MPTDEFAARLAIRVQRETKLLTRKVHMVEQKVLVIGQGQIALVHRVDKLGRKSGKN